MDDCNKEKRTFNSTSTQFVDFGVDIDVDVYVIVERGTKVRTKPICLGRDGPSREIQTKNLTANNILGLRQTAMIVCTYLYLYYLC